MTLSIIIATYNSESTLERCLNSILSQTYADIEVIVIDGASTDSTTLILKQHSEIIRYISEPDNGIYDAWNKGLDMTSGDFITFLGADDFLKNDDNIEELMSHVTINDQIVYSVANVCDLEQNHIKYKGKPWETIQKNFFLAKLRDLPHPGMLHNKNLFLLNGKFDSNFKITGDLDFLYRVLGSKKIIPKFIDKLCFTIQEGGISQNLSNQITSIKEAKLALKKNDLMNTQLSIRFFFRLIKVKIKSLILKQKSQIIA